MGRSGHLLVLAAIIVVRNLHTLSSLSNANSSSYCSGGQKSDMVSLSQNQGVGKAVFLTGSWRRGEHFFAFYGLQRLPTFLGLWPPSSIFKASKIVSVWHLLHHYCSFWTQQGKVPWFSGLMWLDWASWIIQDYLPISRSLTHSDLQIPFCHVK